MEEGGWKVEGGQGLGISSVAENGGEVAFGICRMVESDNGAAFGICRMAESNDGAAFDIFRMAQNGDGVAFGIFRKAAHGDARAGVGDSPSPLRAHSKALLEMEGCRQSGRSLRCSRNRHPPPRSPG